MLTPELQVAASSYEAQKAHVSDWLGNELFEPHTSHSLISRRWNSQPKGIHCQYDQQLRDTNAHEDAVRPIRLKREALVVIASASRPHLLPGPDPSCDLLVPRQALWCSTACSCRSPCRAAHHNVPTTASWKHCRTKRA
mgnify:CR=1 FL=1